MKEQERRQVYAKFYTQHEIEKNHILYEADYGRGMTGNPYGIFRAFRKRKDFTQYEHFWVMKNWKENARIMELYKNDQNVHFIRYMSEEYLYHAATAAYLINDLAFPSFYTPRKGQIYFNTWHEMKPGEYGFDARDGNVEVRNIIRNFLASDYLLASDDRMEEIYQKSFKLKGIYKGIILRGGEPRLDMDNNSLQNWEENGTRLLNIIIDHAGIPKKESILKKIKKKAARKKETVLFYGSDLRENGVTYSLLSLLDSIDYRKYDVTLLAVLNREGTNRKKICAVNPNVRVITRFGAPNGTPQEQKRYEKALKQGIPAEAAEREALRQYMEREFRRMFGRADFDHLIEFTGYSPHYGMLFAAVKKGRKYIWQHSDLGRETKKELKKGVSLQQTLGTVFSLYPYYDKIVACSESVRNLNRKTLDSEAAGDKFVYVRNSFSADRVRTDAEVPYDQIEEYRRFQRPEKNCMVYANMGRLSPEKNQKNLIEAFRKLHEEYHDTQLYILGDGPLKEELEKLTGEYHLERDVILTGNLLNPFALLKECGCFVLPSLYEGQPMSVLEVRVLGLPILISDFETRRDVCMPAGQIVVKQDPESIYQGMKQVYQNRKCGYHFKPEQYNKKAYREFENLLKGK